MPLDKTLPDLDTTKPSDFWLDGLHWRCTGGTSGTCTTEILGNGSE